MSNFKIGQYYDLAFKEMPSSEILDNLEAVAYGLTESSYTKHLTEDEVIQRKDEYSSLAIKLSEIAEQKKEAVERFKILAKEPKEISASLLKTIKFKSEQMFGKLYLVDDQEAGMMYFFDATGICVDARPLTKQEKQTKLRTLKASNDE